MCYQHVIFFFFFIDTATTEIYTLSLHDALPISRVHLNEVELTVLVEELKSASTPIADVQTGLDAGVVNEAAGFRIDIRRRGLFQNFLVAALHGAIPVTQVNGIALAVGKYLNFHVARPLQELFQINGIVTKGGLGFCLGNMDGVEQGCFCINHLHATTTATSGSLDDDRIADLLSNTQGFLRVLTDRPVGTGYGGHTSLTHGLEGGHFVTHQPDHVRGWADEGKTTLFHLLGKVGIFCQEAIAGMDGHRVGDLSRTDNGGNIEVAVFRIAGADA